MRLHIYVNGVERTDIPERLLNIEPDDTSKLMSKIRETIRFLKSNAMMDKNATIEKIMTKIQRSYFWSSTTEPIDLNTNNTVNISDIKDDIYVYLTSYDANGGTRRKRRRRKTRR
jgi:hypothetical protein